jgi:nitrite reductase (NADH) small subunit
VERCVVARLADFPPGTRKIVTVGGRSIGVFNIRGRLYGLRNRCPHQGAPLCAGRIKGTTLPGRPYEYVYGREDEIIQCPWHGWEFEIATGRTYFNPHRMRVKTYAVTVEPAVGAGENDVTLETFEVTTEGEFVVLHA